MVVEGNSTINGKKIWYENYPFVAGEEYAISADFYLKLDSTLTSMKLGFYVNDELLWIIDTVADKQRTWIGVGSCFTAQPGDNEISIRQYSLGGACGIDNIETIHCIPKANPVVVSTTTFTRCLVDLPMLVTVSVNPPGPVIRWYDGFVGSSRYFSTFGNYPFIVIDSTDNFIVDSIVITEGVCNMTLNLKMFIEGYYTLGGIMNAPLNILGFSIDPFISDSVKIELHDPFNPTTVLAIETTVVDNYGNAIAHFPNFILDSSAYIVIIHKNSIETWSKLPVILGTNTNFDFTKP